MYSSKPVDKDTAVVRVGVGVIVIDRGDRILLEKRSDCGLWGLPGGRIEPGESITEAAVREVREETGLTVEISQLLGVYSDPSEHRIVTYPDNVVHLVDIILEARVINGELTCSSESEMVEFFSLGALPADIVPPACSPLKDYVAKRVGIVK